MDGICKDIHRSCFKFNLNSFGYNNPKIDEMIEKKILKKTLESDNIIYTEGYSTILNDPEFYTKEEHDD